MKKAFDQTVRDLKREVNKKVLKVPGIEQKILDATSNEPWGPHGTLLADIAQATRNYHEYQIIMHVIWKRLNDTGKNWRHVYKSLTVLEYLVGHGSERVVDEIKEHAYQISTLSDFQYIDSSGKDQGNNVRRKSQILVSLVNDKEKIQETRQKALTNKDKYRSTFSSSGSHRPSSFSSAGGYGDRYDDDRYDGRYGSRDDDRNGYGRERDLGYRDDDRYARGADYNRDGDGFGRDSDEHSGRGSYKSDDNRSSRGGDDYQFGQRNKSFDKDKDHSYEEDDNYSYRNGGVRANDTSPDARNLESKLSEQRASAPPSYESAVRNDNNTVQDDRGGVGTTAVPKASSPQNNYNGEHRTFLPGTHILPTSMDDNTFDEFDPRGLTPTGNFALPAANYPLPAAGGGSVIDFFSDSSSLDPANSLALALTSPPPPASEAEVASTSSGFGTNFVALPSASAALSQPTEDPFGDSPFKALPQENFVPQGQNSMPAVSALAPSFPPSATSMSPVESITHPGSLVYSSSLNFDFGEPLAGLSYTPTIPNDPPYPANSTPATQEFPLTQPSIDFMAPTQVPASTAYGHPFFQSPGLAAFSSPAPQTFGPSNAPSDGMASISQLATLPIPPSAQQPAAQANAPAVPRMSIAARPSGSKQLPDAFETKSSVWADTLNRGLVNLNISGSKTNPLADIGVDFDSINRLERRKEKEKAPSANPLTSTATMGKAMGTGSGIGRSGAAAAGGVTINQSSRPMMGHPGMGMGMVMTPTGGAGNLGMGIGGSMNQPSLGMGMGMGMGGPMNQSLPQGYPGPSYTPSMMGMGGYGSHQPYAGSNGGGYR